MDEPEKGEEDYADILRRLSLGDDATPVIMGETPDWFTGADAHILFIMMTGLTLTPSVIAENTSLSRVTVSRRLNTLQAGGYVEKVSRGKYKITPDGAFVVTGGPEVYESTSAENAEDVDSEE